MPRLGPHAGSPRQLVSPRWREPSRSHPCPWRLDWWLADGVWLACYLPLPLACSSSFRDELRSPGAPSALACSFGRISYILQGFITAQLIEPRPNLVMAQLPSDEAAGCVNLSLTVHEPPCGTSRCGLCHRRPRWARATVSRRGPARPQCPCPPRPLRSQFRVDLPCNLPCSSCKPDGTTSSAGC